MLNLKIKSKSIQKVIKSLKRNKQPNTTQEPAAPLRDRIVTKMVPFLAKKLNTRTRALDDKQSDLERREAQLGAAKTAFDITIAATEEKQARVRRGAAVMFRANRLQAQVEKEEQRRALNALESGMYLATQKELEAVSVEHERVVTLFLTAAAAQNAATAAAVYARTKADAISEALTTTLDAAHRERVHLQTLTEGVRARSTELDVMVSVTNQRLGAAQASAARLHTAASAITITQGQVETRLAEDRERHSQAMLKERDDALEEARTETQTRLAALREARAAFERVRATEKLNLALGHARVAQSRAAVDMEKGLVKKEMERARLLGVRAEKERAASVDARRVALGELQAATIMRDGSRHALHELMAIADEMATPLTGVGAAIANKATTKDENKETNAEMHGGEKKYANEDLPSINRRVTRAGAELKKKLQIFQGDNGLVPIAKSGRDQDENTDPNSRIPVRARGIADTKGLKLVATQGSKPVAFAAGLNAVAEGANRQKRGMRRSKLGGIGNTVQ